MKLDTVDLEILRRLQEDARTSLLDLSKATGVSRPTVKARIERLQKEGVIKAFTIILDRNAIREGMLLFLRLRTDETKEVAETLRGMGEVLEVYELMGERNLLCKAAVPGMGELQDLMERIHRLPVTQIESQIVFKTHKEEYEVPIGPEIGVVLDCEYCGMTVAGVPKKFTLHNRERYFCCNTCLKAFKKQTSLAKRMKKK